MDVDYFDDNFHQPEQNIHVWRCSSRERHVVISNAQALKDVSNTLEKKLPQIDRFKATKIKPVVDVSSQIEELQSRRRRLEEGYLAGLFSLQSFTYHVAELDRQIAVLEQNADEEVDAETKRASRYKA